MEGDSSFYTDLLNEGVYNDCFGDMSNTPIEFQQTPPIKENNPSSKGNQKQKGKNFIEDEDRLLVSAWLNVSTDSTQGTNQTKATFWKRIYLYYESNRESFAERTQNSLLHRWSSIQEAVSRFCGCITSIDNRNQSGITIHDRVEQAEILFRSQDPNKKSFQFMHCWFMLRTQPKWLDKLQQMAETRTTNKKQKTTKNATPGMVDLTMQDGNEVVPPEADIPQPVVPSRPMGKKKKAKDALRRGGRDACTETLDIHWAKKREADVERDEERGEICQVLCSRQREA